MSSSLDIDQAWLQTVCKDYQQTTLIGKELRVNADIFFNSTPSFEKKHVDLSSKLIRINIKYIIIKKSYTYH